MERINTVTLWMGRDTVIDGTLRRNGEEIKVPGWDREQLQAFAYDCAHEGVSIQAEVTFEQYICSYVVGDPITDGKLYRRDY